MGITEAPLGFSVITRGHDDPSIILRSLFSANRDRDRD